MSYRTSLIKLAIKWTPKALILWVANTKLKGVAKLTDFGLDLDGRTAYFQTRLFGEEETIEVRLADFAVLSDGEAYQLIIQQAHSNQPWLNNLLSRIVGKPWKLPVPPHLRSKAELLSELFSQEARSPG
jgi:hypothetical protein